VVALLIFDTKIKGEYKMFTEKELLENLKILQNKLIYSEDPIYIRDYISDSYEVNQVDLKDLRIEVIDSLYPKSAPYWVGKEELIKGFTFKEHN